MLSMGEQGYLNATEAILGTADRIRKGIEEIPELTVFGNPLWVIAFSSEEIDIYRLMDVMTEKSWNLSGLYKPSCVHICTTLRHTQPGVAERFIADLKEAVAQVKANPKEKGGMAPVYGLAATLPFRGVVKDLLKRYLDLYYKA